MDKHAMWVPRLAMQMPARGFPMGQVTAWLLLMLILLQGVAAQTPDETNLFKFLETAQPDFRSVYNTSVSACEWAGVVTCNVGLGAQRKISALDFSGRGLNGTILPGTLGLLNALTSLDLSDNILTGDIPLDIFNLSSLTNLRLANNKLTGGLSPLVSKLPQLVALDLSLNVLSGPLPLMLGALPFLSFLDLHSNSFNGTIPVFTNPGRLRHLDLSSNQLSGEVPWAFDKLSELVFFNLSSNLLTRPISWQFQKLIALQVLDISENDFEGPIPSFANLQELTTVSLSSNRFNGSMPESLTGLPHLQSLSLANNMLIGPLPTLSPSISFLDCSNNFLNGSIPGGVFASAVNLLVVRLARNNFTGALPTGFSDKIQELDFQSNSFGGSIPEGIAALPALEKLELSGNQLGGGIPWDFVGLSTMRYVGLARNLFVEGVLPNASIRMVNISYLNLSFCNLGGPILDSFAALGSLVHLDLSHNHLNGSIPAGFSGSTVLESMDLSFNNLTGAIPPELTSLPVLAQVDFSYNNLSGEIPSSNSWDNFNSAAFQGNPQLCGHVLKKVCPGSSPAPTISRDPHWRHHHFRGQHLRVGAIIGILIGSIVSCCGFLAVLLLLLKRQPRKLAAKDVSKYLSSKLPVTFEADPSTWAVQVPSAGSIPVIMFEKPLLNLTFADLLQATDNFHKDNQISDGGYGPSYKGTFAGGFQIVVKVLFEGGPANELEKAAQLEALGKIRHPNLVSLVGYCLVGEERLLVYEFMENGDVQRRLHELPEGN
jgi:Leucine-rich repeat (LRR) protein